MAKYSFEGEVWRWTGVSAWHFISVSQEVSDAIKKSREGVPRVGWGAIPVSVRVGESAWKTSIFPDKKSGTFLLPLKADIRKKEGLVAGNKVEVNLSVD
jgi:hypothetical protein